MLSTEYRSVAKLLSHVVATRKEPDSLLGPQPSAVEFAATMTPST